MPQGKLYKDRNLQILFSVTLMGVLGVSSITPAFPRIVEELHISSTHVGMLIVAFTIPGVVITPFLGIMADRFGRRRILVPCLFLFGLAGGSLHTQPKLQCLDCAASPTGRWRRRLSLY